MVSDAERAGLALAPERHHAASSMLTFSMAVKQGARGVGGGGRGGKMYFVFRGNGWSGRVVGLDHPAGLPPRDTPTCHILDSINASELTKKKRWKLIPQANSWRDIDLPDWRKENGDDQPWDTVRPFSTSYMLHFHSF